MSADREHSLDSVDATVGSTLSQTQEDVKV